MSLSSDNHYYSQFLLGLKPFLVTLVHRPYPLLNYQGLRSLDGFKHPEHLDSILGIRVADFR